VFLTPLGALAALTAVVPLAALAVASVRERRGREALDLRAPAAVRRLPRALGVAAVPILLGLAAAQPAIRTSTRLHVRTDAEALFVLDNSRSMAASTRPGAPTRLARAKAAAVAIREGIADVPSGVATLSDRVLPNLLPNPDPSVFAQTVGQAVSIEQPPPASAGVLATSLDALGATATQNFFSPSARKRLVVVLTDGESAPFDARRVARELGSGPGVSLILVRVARSNESVYTDGKPEGGYRPDPTAVQALSSLAASTGGTLTGESSIRRAVAAARARLGSGPVVAAERRARTRTLAPFIILAALIPLGLVLWPGLAGSLRTLAAAATDRRPKTPHAAVAHSP
jgi:hypothetical protein